MEVVCEVGLRRIGPTHIACIVGGQDAVFSPVALARRELEVKFRASGDVYRYFDVPGEEYAAFLAAESKGLT